MLERAALIEDIRRRLAQLELYLRPGGTLNLTDGNVHAEHFVAGLLNAIHGWNLVSTNQKTANFPSIDLIDETRRIGVQVTSERSSAKLTETIEGLKKHSLAAKIQQLKVFSLVAKQERYTVSAGCPGVAFDWKTDVLDFGDALQAASGISDLEPLRRVHRYVVDNVPAAAGARLSPPLNVPVTDPAKAWLAFSSRTTSLVGRDTEHSRLTEFIGAAPMFSWWLMTGSAGSGKSRLALELCRQAGPDWHAGFLTRTEKGFDWSQFKPSRKTLVVVDYVASRAAEVSDVVLTLCRNAGAFAYPVRVLLVERDKGSWWNTFARTESQSESAEMTACQHADPLGLTGLDPTAVLRLAGEVVRARGGRWDAAIARELVARLYDYDPRGRPLFAMIIAQYLEASAADPNLLQVVLKREAARRRKLIPDPDRLQRLENLLLLATMVSGLLPKGESFEHLRASAVAGLLPDVGLLDEALYSDLAGAPTGGTALAGLQPDILGERFVLDRLSEPGIAGMNARRLLHTAWALQPDDVGVVAVRTAYDFHGDAGLEKLFELPFESSDARAKWADTVGDLIGNTASVEYEFSERQRRKLTALANKHPEERELQEATARADYNMGRVCMFGEGAPDIAVERFDAAIARANKDSLIGKMALHNRGILSHRENESDSAFAAYTAMIDFHEAPDEMRACAFNNRADVYAEWGEHEHAIRDRTAVLALADTSPDRRFIALFRRSRSHSALGDHAAALDDLGKVLETWDISPQQKAEARLERALRLRHLERWDEVRADLQAVIESARLFTGMRVIALVELADVSRVTGDHNEANRLLARAVEEPDAYQETMVYAMIVGAQLLEDTGDTDQAKGLWQSVFASPMASEEQVRRARLRLDALGSSQPGDDPGATPA